jgi:hypothetical protein
LTGAIERRLKARKWTPIRAIFSQASGLGKKTALHPHPLLMIEPGRTRLRPLDA